MIYAYLLLFSLSLSSFASQEGPSLRSSITEGEKIVWAAAALSPIVTGLAQFFFKHTAVGHKPLSAEFEAKTRAVLQDMGMKNWQTVPLYKVNKAIATNQESAGFALGNAMFIDETSAKKLSDQEFRFLIGHEATHIIHNDTTTLSIFLTLMPLAFYGVSVITSTCIQWLYKKQTSYTYTDTALRMDYGLRFCATLAAINISFAAFRRYQEARADKTSIERLACPAGCIEFFENFKKKYPQEPHPLLHTHPCYADRIKMAQEYQEKHTINTDLT